MPKPPNHAPPTAATAYTGARSGNATPPSGNATPPNGTITLYEHIRFTHADAVKQARELAASWDTLDGQVDAVRFAGVQARFAQQVRDAAQMADDIMAQYQAWAGH